MAPATLAHWHAELAARGAGYTDDPRLRDDWALCVMQQFAVLAARCGEPGGVSDFRWLWEMQLRRALATWADARP